MDDTGRPGVLEETPTHIRLTFEDRYVPGRRYDVVRPYNPGGPPRYLEAIAAIAEAADALEVRHPRLVEAAAGRMTFKETT